MKNQGKCPSSYRFWRGAYFLGLTVIIVTPVCLSPCCMARWIGDAPLHLGNRDPWILSIPEIDKFNQNFEHSHFEKRLAEFACVYG